MVIKSGTRRGVETEGGQEDGKTSWCVWPPSNAREGRCLLPGNILCLVSRFRDGSTEFIQGAGYNFQPNRPFCDTDPALPFDR